MLEVLLELLGHGPPAACAAGQVALALWAHQGGAALAPWEREYNYVKQSPPPPFLFRGQLQPGGIWGRIRTGCL
jgi:hypothetical protein